MTVKRLIGERLDYLLPRIRLILDVDNEQFKITRVTGDLHKLEPTEKFDGFAAGEEVVLPLTSEYLATVRNRLYAGCAFVTAPNAEPKMIASIEYGRCRVVHENESRG